MQNCGSPGFSNSLIVNQPLSQISMINFRPLLCLICGILTQLTCALRHFGSFIFKDKRDGRKLKPRYY